MDRQLAAIVAASLLGFGLLFALAAAGGANVEANKAAIAARK